MRCRLAVAYAFTPFHHIMEGNKCVAHEIAWLQDRLRDDVSRDHTEDTDIKVGYGMKKGMEGRLHGVTATGKNLHKNGRHKWFRIAKGCGNGVKYCFICGLMCPHRADAFWSGRGRSRDE